MLFPQTDRALSARKLELAKESSDGSTTIDGTDSKGWYYHSSFLDFLLYRRNITLRWSQVEKQKSVWDMSADAFVPFWTCPEASFFHSRICFWCQTTWKFLWYMISVSISTMLLRIYVETEGRRSNFFPEGWYFRFVTYWSYGLPWVKGLMGTLIPLSYLLCVIGLHFDFGLLWFFGGACFIVVLLHRLSILLIVRLVGLLACLRVGLMKASKEMNGKSRSSDSSSTENKIPDATVGKVSQNPTASDKSGLSFF